ncbi:hypothetical protein RHOSPDRAFT_33669 [Rhodotorula sp. JG-1b]|nr:hypothetical protein RHOSPDRAFT_33669 [Rhodotorula sp. JG-1b]
MSPPDSPASSDHEPDSGEENAAQDLSGALSRLRLNPNAFAGNGTDSTDSSGSDGGSTVDSTEDGDNGSGRRRRSSLLSDDDAGAYARTVILATLSRGNPTHTPSRPSRYNELAFYQSLILQFVSTIAKTEAHAGAGDAGEGYQAPQGGPRFEEGKENSHKALDSTDERSIANRLAAAEKADKEDENSGNAYAGVGAAEAHGNKPSRGAEIDAELQKEEEELLAKKDK